MMNLCLTPSLDWGKDDYRSVEEEDGNWIIEEVNNSQSPCLNIHIITIGKIIIIAMIMIIIVINIMIKNDNHQDKINH